MSFWIQINKIRSKKNNINKENHLSIIQYITREGADCMRLVLVIFKPSNELQLSHIKHGFLA